MGKKKLLRYKKEGSDLARVSKVIVSIKSGDSYDDRFCLTREGSSDAFLEHGKHGTTALYTVDSGPIIFYLHLVMIGKKIKKIDLFPRPEIKGKKAALLQPVDENEEQLELLKELKAMCDQVGPQSVFFNFECCAGYSEAGFGQNPTVQPSYHELIAFLVRIYGATCLFCDFSLKALISNWSNKLLGPKPFTIVGQFADELFLSFYPFRMKSTNIPALQKLGHLVPQASTTSRKNGLKPSRIDFLAQKETILYTVNTEVEPLLRRTENNVKERYKTPDLPIQSPYEIEILSVASYFNSGDFTRKALSLANQSNDINLCILDEKNFGFCGHAVITYPTKNPEKNPNPGRIVVSCAHMSDIVSIPASSGNLLNVVEKSYGPKSKEYYHVLERLKFAKTDFEKNQTVQDLSIGLVKGVSLLSIN
eukprot:maker-scaffold_12-snap-gene-10.56-mRNA-1 protein AED:0.00 eAED:0.00 QI:28/1/1/1/0/0/2/41/420